MLHLVNKHQILVKAVLLTYDLGLEVELIAHILTNPDYLLTAQTNLLVQLLAESPQLGGYMSCSEDQGSILQNYFAVIELP